MHPPPRRRLRPHVVVSAPSSPRHRAVVPAPAPSRRRLRAIVPAPPRRGPRRHRPRAVVSTRWSPPLLTSILTPISPLSSLHPRLAAAPSSRRRPSSPLYAHRYPHYPHHPATILTAILTRSSPRRRVVVPRHRRVVVAASSPRRRRVVVAGSPHRSCASSPHRRRAAALVAATPTWPACRRPLYILTFILTSILTYPYPITSPPPRRRRVVVAAVVVASSSTSRRRAVVS